LKKERSWIVDFIIFHSTNACDLVLALNRSSQGQRRKSRAEMMLKNKVAVIYGAGGAKGGAVAEPPDRAASNREGRRVVAEGDPLQGRGITRCECTRRSRDQLVHRNPATLVTPTVGYAGATFISRPPTSRSYRERKRMIRTLDEGRKTMTATKTGTSEQWLTARLEPGKNKAQR
jgi:hypothetical protein